MTKKLLVQIKNEWRNNLWLALELLVVSVVMWYVVDYLYTRAATYLEPRGFNIENCYLIELGELTPKSPDYIADRKSEDTHNDIAELVERLRRRPEVEAVSLSQNSYPYNGSNSRRGIFLRLMGEGILLLTVAAIPALIIAFNVGIAELVDISKMQFTVDRFLIAAILTWLLMALMIIVGIWYPAYKAMQLQPAEALHDE